MSPKLDGRAETRAASFLLSRPAATLSSIRNGGEGRGEEALGGRDSLGKAKHWVR